MNLELLTKYTLADLYAWIGFHRGSDKEFFNEYDLLALGQLVERFLKDKK